MKPKAPGGTLKSALLAVCGAGGLLLASSQAYAQYDLLMDLAIGKYVEAEKGYEARIQSDADKTASNLAPLCYVYYRLRRYDKIFPCIADLEKRIAAGDHVHSGSWTFDSDVTALPHYLRAGVLLDLGNPASALREGKLALDAVKEVGSAGLFAPAKYRTEILPIVGIAAAIDGQQEEAERDLAALAGLDIPFAQGAILRNLKDLGQAQILVSLGRFGKALEFLSEEGGRFSRGLGDLLLVEGDDSVTTVFALPMRLMAARCFLELDRTADAKKSLDALLAHKRAPDQGNIYWIALFERGEVAEREHNPAEAIEYYRKAIEVIERQRASITSETSKIGFVGDKQAVYGRLVALLVQAGQVADAFDYVERSKARALVDMLASKNDFASRASDPDKAKQVLAELDVADSVARAQVAGADAAVSGARKLDAVKKEIQQTAPELSTLVTVTSIPVSELKGMVGQDEALIEYYSEGSKLYAFVLNRGDLAAFDLGPGRLGDEVQDFRRALQDPGSATWQEGARALYQRLWRPLEAAIGARRVVIVPHGPLHYLPFATLQAPDGKLLIDRYSLRFLPSASVLKFLRPPASGKEGTLLVFGNPDLGDPALDLKFAETEARTIAGLVPQSRLLLRKDASESNFKRAGRLFSRIHFATHGRFQADDPLNSGLYLAKDADDNGVLTVNELYSVSLEADLVTLSACETGLGKVANGDDVVGLTRGFLYAGARSIVASLWSVDDKATSELMDAFYENLPKLSKQEALREAQLKTRQDFPHPFFWGAFELTGRAE